MKQINLIIALVLCMSLIIAGCDKKGNEENNSETIGSNVIKSNEEDKTQARDYKAKDNTEDKAEANSDNADDIVEKEEDEADKADNAAADKKIVAGTFMAAELLDILEVDNVVGILSSSKTLPTRYDDVPRVGNPMKPDLESVVAVDPDLYIADANVKETLEELFKGQDLEKMYLTNNSYDDVLNNIQLVGDIVGKSDKANELVSEMKEKEAEILSTINEDEKPEVLIIFGTPESFMIATQYSYTGSLVEKLGGVNVASGLATRPAPYISFSLETVAELNPDIILRLTHANPEESKKAFDAEFEKGFWVNLDAVKNGNVYDQDPQYFGVSGNMQFMKALEEMAKILYQ